MDYLGTQCALFLYDRKEPKRLGAFADGSRLAIGDDHLTERHEGEVRSAGVTSNDILSESRVIEAACTVIVPAFNEETGLATVLSELCANLPNCGLKEFEIIVVDDGSSDGTGDIARSYEGVTVVTHQTNRGYGAALKSGIRHAHYELVCFTDADGTYPNQRIPDLTAHLIAGEHDMVVGARTGESVVIPFIRRPAKWVIGRLANFVAGMPIPDFNSGLRVLRRQVALQWLNLLPDGFSFTTTITLAMVCNSYSVDYLPINYHARLGRSKIRPIHDTLNFAHLVLRIALYFAPLKVFLPLSGFLLAAALVWALFSKFILGQLADVSTLVIAMTGIEVIMMGMLAELINQRLPRYNQEK
jgi:glycosyltransferase involved in cell wall biosynthesis